MEFITNGFVLLASFAGMELVAWALHKYILHTFLWVIHESHHIPRNGTFEKNDLVALWRWMESTFL